MRMRMMKTTMTHQMTQWMGQKEMVMTKTMRKNQRAKAEVVQNGQALSERADKSGLEEKISAEDWVSAEGLDWEKLT
jgi:hypothetical protein